MLDILAPTTAGSSNPAAFAFGRFVLRRRERLLMADGVPVELGSRAVEVLLALVEADGELLTKGAILDRVWPGVTVEENSLQVQISSLRRALGSEGREWIATVAGRGYRFTGPVAALGEGEGRPARSRPRMVELPSLSVLVLPFISRGSHPDGEWFAGALTDGLTTDLARALPAGSAVAAQATAKIYRDNTIDVRAIGREQGVRYVLEGSLLSADDRVRVNAQLIAADSGAHLWADRFDALCGGDSNVLPLQDIIIGRVARAVGLQIVQAEARRAERAELEHPGEGTSEDYALRARALAHTSKATRDDLELVCALYKRALARDPRNAEALAGLACARVEQVVDGYVEGGWTVHDKVSMREAHLAEAEQHIGQALSLTPGHPLALKARSGLLRARGAFMDAIAAAEAALAQDPAELATMTEIGLCLLHLGRAEEAIAWFRRADALGPSDLLRWTWLQGLGVALIQLGRHAEAADVLRLAIASNPTSAPCRVLLAAALALAGNDGAARAVMADLRRAEPDSLPETLARRSVASFEFMQPLYGDHSERVLEGLRRAAVLPSA